MYPPQHLHGLHSHCNTLPQELELQRQAVSELTTQLEQTRQEITEKEAESKAWEKRAAGLLQQLKEKNNEVRLT